MLWKFYTKVFLLTNSANASNWTNIKSYFRLLWGKLESQKWNKMKTIYLVALSNNTLLNSKWNQNVYFWFWPYMLKITVYSCPGSCMEEFSLWVRESKRKESALLSTPWQTKNENYKQKASQGLRGPPADQYISTHLFWYNHSV